MCLKHFRQQKYTTAFNALQKKTGVTLESPQLSCLYQLLVEDGDFDAAEKLLQNAANGKITLFIIDIISILRIIQKIIHLSQTGSSIGIQLSNLIYLIGSTFLHVLLTWWRVSPKARKLHRLPLLHLRSRQLLPFPKIP